MGRRNKSRRPLYIILVLLLASAAYAANLHILGDNKKLFWYDTDSGTDFTISFRAPELTANFDYVWPDRTGTFGNPLFSNGTASNTLAWGFPVFVGTSTIDSLPFRLLKEETSSSGSILEIMRLVRQVDEEAGTNGDGAQINFYIEDTTSGVDAVAYISAHITSSSRGNLALGVDVDGGQNFHDIIRIGDASQDVAFYDFDSGFYTTFNFSGLTSNHRLAIDMGGDDRDIEWLDSAGANSTIFVEAAARIDQDYTADASPTFFGLTISTSTVLTAGTATFQPATDTVTFLQIKDKDGGIPILNVDTVNERVGIGTATPTVTLDVSSGTINAATSSITSLTVDTLTFDFVDDDYKLLARNTGSNDAFAIQSQTSAAFSFLELFAKDGDGTDVVSYQVYAQGTPSDVSNSETLSFGYDGTRYVIFSNKAGGGTIHPIRIYTGANTTQLVLNTDNTIDMSGDLDVAGAITTASLTVTDSAALSSDSAVFQPNTDSTTFMQVLDADGGTPVMNWDTTNERVGIGTAAPSYALSIGSTDGSDEAGIFHDNSNMQFRTSDNGFTFISVETANRNTLLNVIGNGTGSGFLRVYDQDEAEFLDFTCSNGSAFFQIAGASTNSINFQNNADVSINCFGSPTEGETPELTISGRRTGDSTRRLEIGVGRDAADTASFDGLSNYYFDGNIGIGTTTVNEKLVVSGNIVIADTGVLFLAETASPTAVADHGALYTTSDNELFFQDGSGFEHLLHGDAFSNIWFHSVTASTTVISAADTFVKIRTFENVGEEDDIGNAIANASEDEITISSAGAGKYDITFHTSITSSGANSEMVIVVGIELATTLNVASATNATPIVITSPGHGKLNGDMITIASSTGNTGANGDWVVTDKTTDTITLVDLGGNDGVGNGAYDDNSGNVTIFYPGNIIMHRVVSQTDLGVGGADADAQLNASDKIALYVANIGATRDLESKVLNIAIFRIGD